jgi:hypothetical protein
VPPRLSAIVPATDSPATLGRCLDAIERAAEPPEEVIVVRRPRRSGPAAARNAGALLAHGDVLVFVDADVVVHPDAFQRIRRAFSEAPAPTAVFGSYDDLVETQGSVSAFRNLLHHDVHQRSAGAVVTFWAGLGAVRREAFLGVGGFDERRYPAPAIEDVELGVALDRAGHRIRLDPELAGTHLKEWTLAGMLHTDLVRRGIPWTRLLLRRRTLPATLNLGWRERASAATTLAGSLSLAGRRPRGAAAALAVLLVLNGRFYGLLARRAGLRSSVLGVGLHGLHQLAAVAAVPLGIGAHLAERYAAFSTRSTGGSVRRSSPSSR